MVRRAEVNELLEDLQALAGSPRGVLTALRLGVRWAADRLRYPRGTRLAMGNALVANLFHQLAGARGPGVVHRHRDAAAHRGRAGRRRRRRHQGRELRVRARRGVVLGGRRLRGEPGLAGALPALAHAAVHPGGARARPATHSRSRRPSAARSASRATTTRSGSPARSAAAATARPRCSRTSGTGPSRASSRSNAAGRRFVDESVSYHRFTRAMYDSHKAVPTIPAWLVIDAAGAAPLRPRHDPPAHVAPLLRKYLKAGYLHRGATSARAGRVDRRRPRRPGAPPSPTTTASPRTGVDEEFGKGTQRVRPPVRRSRRTRPTSTSARSRPRRSTRSRWCRRRWAPRSGCAPTRPRGCSTRPAHRSRGLYACGNDASR